MDNLRPEGVGDSFSIIYDVVVATILATIVYLMCGGWKDVSLLF